MILRVVHAMRQSKILCLCASLRMCADYCCVHVHSKSLCVYVRVCVYVSECVCILGAYIVCMCVHSKSVCVCVCSS